jgi:lupus La protein
MWEKTGGPENKPISVKYLCTFNRMKRFQPYSAVIAALKESEFLDVSGEEGEEVVKRKTPYEPKPDSMKNRVARSVYVKGFGEEEASTQFDIETWFANYGQVRHLKLRRTDENEFKGSVFLEFGSEQVARDFVKLDPAPTWNGKELKIMMKQEYLNEKMRAINAGEIEPSKTHKPTFWEGRQKGVRGGRGGNRGGHENGKKNFGDKQRNGFQGRGGGRGGRGGRGRGSRGGWGGRGGRDNRDRRDDRRNDRDDAAPRSSTNEFVSPRPLISDVAAKTFCSVKLPTIQSSGSNGKRAREDEGGEQAPPAKKVDAKTETPAAA